MHIASKTNLLIIGATGSGKSSTINALLGFDAAKVGTGVDPETMEIEKYEIGNLVIWDSPGLGDGEEMDALHELNISSILTEWDEDSEEYYTADFCPYLIDLVLVILDGSNRDLGTSYELINEVIIPNLGKKNQDRILVAINQADVAMKGRHWNHKNNKPMPELIKFLDEQADSVQRRIKEATGLDTRPINFAAGYKEEGEEQKPWNLSELSSLIMRSIKPERRFTCGLGELEDEITNLKTTLEEFEEKFEVTTFSESKSYSASPIDTIFDAADELATTIIDGIFSLFD